MSESLSYADAIAVAVRESLDLAALREAISAGLERAIRDPRFDLQGRLLLTGSGDSLFAATSTLPAIRRWAGLPAQTLTAIEFARYEVPLLEPTDSVFGISNSGSSARTREAITLARARGNLAIGITGSLQGPLAELADLLVHRPVQPITSLPASYQRVFLNMTEYLATLYALYALGLEIGQARGHLSAAEKARWYTAIEAAIAALPATAAAAEPGARALAEALRSADTLWTIGAGPTRGTADYCAAKFHEQIPLNGIAQDLEESAHLQYFLTLGWGRRSVVLVLAAPGNALDRAEEVVQGIASAGGLPVVITAPQSQGFAQATARFDIDFDVHELLSPLLYHLPGQLLVLHLARLAGVEQMPLKRQDDYWLIRKGLVRDNPHGLL